MNLAEPIALPPQSIEAEQSVLGGLLLLNSAWDRIGDMVQAEDFYRDDHKRIFRHIARMIEDGKPADVVTVFESLEKSGEEEHTGGLAYLGEIANNTPSAANIHRYAEIVREKRLLRELIAASFEIQGLAQATGPEPAADRVDRAQALLMGLSEATATKSEPREVGAILGSVIEEIEARMNRGGEVSGLESGFTDLDAMLDGFKAGDLILLAGRPSQGKTALAMNIAEQVAMAGNPVLFFSLEMGDTQLVTRCLASVGGINGKSLASGNMDDEEWSRVTAALSRLHAAPMLIDQSPALSASQMRARARRQKRKGGLSLVVIDYLQLMRGQGNNRNEELGDITRQLKLMARDLECPVLALSQLSRKCEERADKRPILSDLRESGSLEQDADVVIMMYREEYYNKETPYKGVAEVLVRKNRMGECGEIRLVFEGEYSRFRNADHAALADLSRRAQDQAEEKKQKKRGFRDD